MTISEAGIAVLDCEHKTPKAQTEGYPYIAIPDIQGGRVSLSNARRISASDFELWTRRTTPLPGDILVTRRGRVGDTAPIPAGTECAIGQNLVLLRSDGQLVRQDYLRWAARGPQWWAEVDRLMNVGAVFSSLNVRDIARLRIPVPTPGEQRAIAEVLGALDDKIAANTKLVGVIDELAEAFTRTSIDTDLPVQLSRIADVTMGSSPTGASLNEDGRGTVFFQGVRDFGFRFPKRRIWTEQVTRLAEAGDTLLSVRAPVGRVNIASEPICIGRGLASIRTRVGEPFTLFNLLKAFPEIWEPFEAEGTIFGSINRAQLEGIEVPRVRPELASALEARLVGLEASITSALAENDSLAELRDTLLPELMSGRLRVSDAEKKVEEAV